MPIQEALSEEWVNLDLAAGTEREAICEVAALLEEAPDVLDFQRFVDELFEREKVCSTASGNGVAFPHARTDAVRRIVIAIGQSKKGVPFSNGQKVHFVVVIGTPKEMVVEYLKLVGKLARLFKNTTVREGLAKAKSSSEFLDFIRKIGLP